jgi:hypothetical protein
VPSDVVTTRRPNRITTVSACVPTTSPKRQRRFTASSRSQTPRRFTPSTFATRTPSRHTTRVGGAAPASALQPAATTSNAATARRMGWR